MYFFCSAVRAGELGAAGVLVDFLCRGVNGKTGNRYDDGEGK